MFKPKRLVWKKGPEFGGDLKRYEEIGKKELNQVLSGAKFKETAATRDYFRGLSDERKLLIAKMEGKVKDLKSPDILISIVENRDLPATLVLLAIRNPSIGADYLFHRVKQGRYGIRYDCLSNPAMPLAGLEFLVDSWEKEAESVDLVVMRLVAGHPNASEDLLRRVGEKLMEIYRAASEGRKLSFSGERGIAKELIGNKNTPKDLVVKLRKLANI